MGKNHLKRIAAPKTWNISRKTSKLIARPYGYLHTALPMSVILGEMLNATSTRAETKTVLRNKNVIVDGKVMSDDRMPVIIMSVVEIKSIGKFRMLINTQGKLYLKPIKDLESEVKPSKIISKTTLAKGKIQLGMHDGRTILTDMKAKVNDTVLFKTADSKPDKVIAFEKGATVYITGGSSVGHTGTVENIGKTVSVKIGESLIETEKENLFAIGKEKPLISVEQ